MSTSKSIYKLINSVYEAWNNKHCIASVLCNITKASNEVLLSKLEHYGVMGIILNWFRSYWSDRRQGVSLDCAATHCFQTDWESAKCGVPQGCILGPMLFNLYNLPKIMDKRLCTVLYADDTNITVTSTNCNDLQKK